jgi:chemotaxis protein MotB
MSSKAAHHPVIIKKRRGKKGGEGHHGGAWKVAYADFVTAMMAFFLLMWLLNATTEEQRKGLADYFNPSIPISRISGGGADALSGSSVFSEDDLARDGTGAVGAGAEGKAEAEQDAEAVERAKLEEIEKRIEEQKAAETDELADHIQTRMTPEGLVVELVDRDGEPLFEVGSSRPSPLLHQLLTIVAPVLATAENDMAIVGHTDSRPYAGAGPYTNWELSSERAQVARRLLVGSGIPASQVASVVGKADREPLLADDPLAARNRRIAVILLALRPEAAAPSSAAESTENSPADYPFLKEPTLQP